MYQYPSLHDGIKDYKYKMTKISLFSHSNLTNSFTRHVQKMSTKMILQLLKFLDQHILVKGIYLVQVMVIYNHYVFRVLNQQLTFTCTSCSHTYFFYQLDNLLGQPLPCLGCTDWTRLGLLW